MHHQLYHQSRAGSVAGGVRGESASRGSGHVGVLDASRRDWAAASVGSRQQLRPPEVRPAAVHLAVGGLLLSDRVDLFEVSFLFCFVMGKMAGFWVEIW